MTCMQDRLHVFPIYYSLTHETQLKTLILKLSDPNLTSSLRWHVHDESLIYNDTYTNDGLIATG